MKILIKREILEHLQSLQFITLIVLSVLLFSINGWISVKKYHEQATRYSEGRAGTTQNPSTRRTSLYMSPNPLILLSDGASKHQPHGYSLTPKGRLDPQAAGPKNFKMPVVPELDWSLIIKMVFSLYVLLLAFRGVSGEKEVGTLCLVLSNVLKRNQLLIAKYIAIMLTIGIPLLLGCLVSLLFVSVFMPEAMSLAVFPRILFMILLAFFYLSIFAFLGLFVSSMTARSSVALLVLLAAWIILVIIVPNVSGILSNRLARVPSEFQTARQVGPVIQEQVWSRINQVKERVEKGELTTEEAIKKETDIAFEQGQEDVRRHYAVYENAMRQRAHMARQFSRVSPAALFQYASESVADTGPRREARFLKDARAYADIYDSYILEKLGQLVGTSHWSFGTGLTLNDKYVDISSPRPKEYHGDKSDFPQFVESKPSLATNAQEAFLDLGGLALWNLILAMLAFWGISRCDVR